MRKTVSTVGRRVPPKVPLLPENQGQLMAAEEGKRFSLGRGKPMVGHPITYKGWPHTHKQLQIFVIFYRQEVGGDEIYVGEEIGGTGRGGRWIRRKYLYTCVKIFKNCLCLHFLFCKLEMIMAVKCSVKMK